jgi:cysteinyl-tRNA synthetase
MVRLARLRGEEESSGDQEGSELAARTEEAFHRAMSEDFNTPAALASLFTAKRQIDSRLKQGSLEPPEAGHLTRTFQSLGGLLGLLPGDDTLLAAALKPAANSEALMAERAGLRRERRYGQADEIRHRMLESGLTVADSPEGSFCHPRLPELSG